MEKIRFAQYGTKHFHAAGKYNALLNNPNVELVGVYEPDSSRRSALKQSDGPFSGATFFDRKEGILGDSSIDAVVSEGMYDENLSQTEEIVSAGKHVWHDKPAGMDIKRWRRVLDVAEKNNLHIQVGYMLRYHNGVRLIEELLGKGILGNIFAVRASMSTNQSRKNRELLSVYRGGAFFDLAPHVLDLITWFLGRPAKVTSFLRSDGNGPPGFADNTLSVLEYEKGLATVSIAAMEINAPNNRRLEVQGTNGNAVLQPLESTDTLRLFLQEARGDYAEGAQQVPVATQSRQELYDLELQAFLGVIRDGKNPDRTSAHDFLVQETLLRAIGEIE